MKQIKIGLMLLLFLCHRISVAQSVAFKANYSIKTTTSYHVDQGYADSMTLYDKIKLMPLTIENSFTEIFYDDSTVVREVLHTYPEDLPEEWLTKPEKTVYTKDSAFSYVNGNIFARMPIENDPIDLYKTAPNYLGTSEFDLPLSQEQVDALEDAEITVVTNNKLILLYNFDNKSVMLNKALMAREICEYDGIKKINSNLTMFKVNENGHFVYDYTVHRALINDSGIEIETVKVKKYNNITREYIDPSLAPEDNYTPENLPSISAYKVIGSNGIQINFSDDCPDNIVVNVLDLYGNIKESNIIVSKLNNIIYPQNLQLGIHVIEVITPTVKSCTFMYIPQY